VSIKDKRQNSFDNHKGNGKEYHPQQEKQHHAKLAERLVLEM
jgi:hypothetical protein